MHNGRRDSQAAQRSAFSRLMAARQAGEAPTRGSTSASAASAGMLNTSTTTSPSTTARTAPSVRLPSINKSADTSSAGRLTSSSHQQLENGFNTQASNTSYVITDRTPRAELVAIVAQLQVDLSQRTDSVNAIQRNFQRLSAMHHQEQEELQRLRALQNQMQRDANRPTAQQVEAQERDLMALRARLEEQQAQCALLQQQHTQAQKGLQLATAIADIVATCSERRRRVVDDEWTERVTFTEAAVEERKRLEVQASERRQQQQEQEQLSSLLQTHVKRIQAVMHGNSASKRSPPSSAPAQDKLVFSSHGTSLVLEGVSGELRKVEDAVEEFVSQQLTSTAQQHSAQLTELQQQVAEFTKHTAHTQQALVEAVVTSEGEMRRTLEESEETLRAAQLNAMTSAAMELQRAAHCVTAVHIAQEQARDLCRTRLGDFLTSADEYMKDMQDTLESWRQSVEGDLRLTQQLLQESGQSASELAAAKAEWQSLRDTERKAHRAELARVRQDAAGKLATVEARLKSTQQQCAIVQKQLEDADAALQSLQKSQATTLEQQVKAAAAEREALLSRQWFRVQAAQKAHASEVTALLWEVLSVRDKCSEEEEHDRRAMYAAHVRGTAAMHSGAVRLRETAAAAAALLQRHIALLTQHEKDARALLVEAAEQEYALLKEKESYARREHAHAAELTHLREAQAANQQRLADADKTHTFALESLKTRLALAEQERHVALDRAAHAVKAAQEAHTAQEQLEQTVKSVRAATAAAARRIEAAEDATESACCCPLCLQLLYNPVACVPCGHVYCAGCLLWHPRNKALSSLTSSAAPQRSRRVSGSALARVEIEVAQWVAAMSVPHSRLFCPECATATVTTVVELHALGELAAKYSYKNAALLELMRELTEAE